MSSEDDSGFVIESADVIPIEKISKKKITSPFMTRYEFARLIAARTVQILSDENFECDDGSLNPEEIAIRELHERRIPLVIIRKLPNGKEEVWKVKDMHIRDH